MTPDARYADLLGDWSGSEELFPTAWTAAGTARGSLTVEPGPGGILFDYVELQDAGHLLAHAVIAGDDFWWFDSYGFTPEAPGSAEWIGDELVLDRRSPRGRTVMRLRRAGDALEVALDSAVPADADLAPLMRGTYARQSA